MERLPEHLIRANEEIARRDRSREMSRCEKCEALRRGLPYPTDETELLLADVGHMCRHHLTEAGLDPL
jgi:hypothetical protein